LHSAPWCLPGSGSLAPPFPCSFQQQQLHAGHFVSSIPPSYLSLLTYPCTAAAAASSNIHRLARSPPASAYLPLLTYPWAATATAGLVVAYNWPTPCQVHPSTPTPPMCPCLQFLAQLLQLSPAAGRRWRS
jgi:hypothetical protein